VAVLNDKGDVNGSGFFITSDGYILTCYHVIEKYLSAKKIDIRMADGTELPTAFEADKSCPEDYIDFAILKVDGQGPFQCLPLRRNFEKGDNCCFIGYSFPTKYKHVTFKGTIIEKVYREGINRGYDIRVGSDYLIKGGASGSPLLNERIGSVVGIISSRPTENGDQQIFATPIDDVFAKWPELEWLNKKFSENHRDYHTKKIEEINHFLMRSIEERIDKNFENLNNAPKGDSIREKIELEIKADREELIKIYKETYDPGSRSIYKLEVQ